MEVKSEELKEFIEDYDERVINYVEWRIKQEYTKRLCEPMIR